MLIKTPAIVFRTHKYGETSLIVELYTELYGLRKYIISGVRSPKARTQANLLQVMNLLDIVAYNRDDRDLNRLKEIRPAYLYQAIPFDVRRGAVGLFMAEIVRKAIQEREPNVPLFHFLCQTFTGLDTTPHPVANYHLGFMVEFAVFLGFQSAGQYTAATPVFDLREGDFVARIPNHPDYLIDDMAQAFDALSHHTAADAHLFAISRDNRQKLLNELIRFYRLHLDGMGEIHAHAVLRDVF